MAGQLITLLWLCWYITCRVCSIFWSVLASALNPADAIKHLSDLSRARNVSEVLHPLALPLRLSPSLVTNNAERIPTNAVSVGGSGTYSLQTLEELRVRMLKPVDMRVSAATTQ
jgi:hypothetical protein